MNYLINLTNPHNNKYSFGSVKEGVSMRYRIKGIYKVNRQSCNRRNFLND